MTTQTKTKKVQGRVRIPRHVWEKMTLSERLNAWANLLSKVKASNFDMQHWIRKGDPRKVGDVAVLNCGTVCCAAGWLPSLSTTFDHCMLNEAGRGFAWELARLELGLDRDREYVWEQITQPSYYTAHESTTYGEVKKSAVVKRIRYYAKILEGILVGGTLSKRVT